MNDDSYDDDDGFTDLELHRIAELVKTPAGLKRKYPTAFAQALKRNMLEEMFIKPEREYRISKACYLWEAIDKFQNNLHIIKTGKCQAEEREKRMHEVAKKQDFEPRLRGFVITDYPAVQLEREIRAVTKKELNHILDVMKKNAKFVLVMDRV